MRVFKKSVLRRIFAPKSDEVTGEWRKLHSGNLHNFYPSPNTIRQIKPRKMRGAENVASMGKNKKVYKVLVGKPDGKRPLGKPRCRWEDEINMGIRKTAWKCEQRIHLAQYKEQGRLL
jgi:hypothetical protein